VYETEAEGEVYVAVDEGVLVKTGPEVLVSVRNAIGGTELEDLREAVEQEFLTLTSTSKACARCWREWKVVSFAAGEAPS
jgi:F-type H+-transporting ATPase subunit epsilon